MIRDKKFLLLLIILVLLGLLYFFYQDENKNKRISLENTFNAEQLESIAINKGVSIFVSLQKEGKVWYLGEKRYLADSQKITKLIRLYASIKDLELISNDKDSLSNYDLDVAKAYHIVFSGKKGKVDYFIGANENGRSYLKYKDSIYQADGNLVSLFSGGEEALREKRLFISDKSDISFFTLRDGEKSYTFNRKEGIWVSADFEGKTLNQENIEAYLQILTSTVVNRFDNESSIEDYNKKKLLREVDVTLKDGKRVVLDFREAREKDNDQRLSVSNRKSLVFIGAYYSETLMQDVSKFLK